MSDPFVYKMRAKIPKMIRDDMGRLLPSWDEWAHRMRLNALERRKTFSTGNDAGDISLWNNFGVGLTKARPEP